MATSPDTTRYFNGLYNDGVGLTSVGSYQIAGTPYLSSSALAAGQTMKFTLPAVSKRLFIENTTPAGAGTDITHLPAAYGYWSCLFGTHFYY